MTKEEAINKWVIPAIKNTWNEKKCGEIIEALEQDDVLDRIRSEIEVLEEGIWSYHNDRPWVFKDEVLQVIDKYRGREDK